MTLSAFEEIVVPNPEHKQLLARLNNVEKFFFFNTENSFEDLVAELKDRLKEELQGIERFSISCNGVPLMCDDDVRHLVDGAVLIIDEEVA